MKKVWIDTDVAIGAPDARGGYADVDDAYAMIQLFHAPEVEVVGISTVFGNTFIENATQIAKELTSSFAPSSSIGVFEGASQAMDLSRLTHNEATLALQAALEKERLHILAIGPASNIGTLLLLQPELSQQIEQVVLVAGRRSLDHHFKVGPDHDPPFPDLNFDLDPNAFQVLIQSGVKVVLHPFEISHKIWVSQQDLDNLAKGCQAAQLLAEKSLPWLQQWEPFDVQAFNPFDVLASSWLVDESFFEWEELPVSIQLAPDDTTHDPDVYKPYLILSDSIENSRTLTYCHSTKKGYKEWLWEMLKNNPNLPPSN